MLCRDNIPCISLHSWDIETEYLDEDVLSGVIPVLFADEPAEAEQSIKANPATLKKDIESLQRVFFIPEQLQLEDALKVVKKPRYGDAEYVWKQRNLERLFEDPPSASSKPGDIPINLLQKYL
jgi:hypothetical protein